jgi:hypothetical protein
LHEREFLHQCALLLAGVSRYAQSHHGTPDMNRLRWVTVKEEEIVLERAKSRVTRFMCAYDPCEPFKGHDHSP